MGKQSIIFLGSKSIGYECLVYLIDKSKQLDLEIKGVLCNENSYAAKEFDLAGLAHEHHIPVFAALDEMPDADILYSVQYHQLLKKHHIAKAQKIALNLHMAPLPEYRGCNQFSFALLDERQEFGTTIHQLDCRIDHGDILFEKRFAIPQHCWIETLYHLTWQASLQLFKETLDDIVHHRYTRTSQQSLAQTRGGQLHFRNEINQIREIDLSWNREKVERHIRATSMPGFEPPYAFIDDKKVYFSTTWQ